MQKLKPFLAKVKLFFKRIPLRAYLLYLLAASVVCTGVTFSSYLSSTSGGDETRVALFANDVSMNIPISDDCYPGCSFEIPITVSNYEKVGLTERICEVSQTYTLEAQLLVGNLPLSIQWKSGNNSGEFGATDPAINNTHYIVVTWPINAESTSYEYADEIEVIRITVDAEQAD